MNESIQTNPTLNRPWKRILYEKQSYRDNYIDPNAFLDQLDLRFHEQRPSFHSIFIGASLIVQQFSIVSIFLTMYKYLLSNAMIKHILLIIDIFILIIGYFIIILLKGMETSLFHTITQCALFGVCLRIVAPILQTLTAPISSDTIHALAITLSTVHLVFHDYAFINAQHEIFSGSIISLNAVMFTSIILASRLHSIEAVLAFLLLAVLSFNLFPFMARLIKYHSVEMHIFLVLILWCIASILLYFLDRTLFVAYEILVIILWILGPFLFYTMHQYKRVMRGPWDTAEVH